MASKKEGKLSKTAEASTNAAARKAEAAKRPTIVTTALCDPCQTKCGNGIALIAKRDAFQKSHPTGAFVNRGVPCHLQKTLAI